MDKAFIGEPSDVPFRFRKFDIVVRTGGPQLGLLCLFVVEQFKGPGKNFSPIDLAKFPHLELLTIPALPGNTSNPFSPGVLQNAKKELPFYEYIFTDPLESQKKREKCYYPAFAIWTLVPDPYAVYVLQDGKTGQEYVRLGGSGKFVCTQNVWKMLCTGAGGCL
jgi:hypothetical protein